MPDFSAVTTDELLARIQELGEQYERQIAYMMVAGASKERAELIAAPLLDESQMIQKEVHARRRVEREIAAAEIEDVLVANIGRDYGEMTDQQIKDAKAALWVLRQKANTEQDDALRSEMIRAQDVINGRQRRRVQEAYRVAAETPGALSTWIGGDVAVVEADSLTPRTEN